MKSIRLSLFRRPSRFRLFLVDQGCRTRCRQFALIYIHDITFQSIRGSEIQVKKLVVSDLSTVGQTLFCESQRRVGAPTDIQTRAPIRTRAPTPSSFTMFSRSSRVSERAPAVSPRVPVAMAVFSLPVLLRPRGGVQMAPRFGVGHRLRVPQRLQVRLHAHRPVRQRRADDHADRVQHPWQFGSLDNGPRPQFLDQHPGPRGLPRPHRFLRAYGWVVQALFLFQLHKLGWPRRRLDGPGARDVVRRQGSAGRAGDGRRAQRHVVWLRLIHPEGKGQSDPRGEPVLCQRRRLHELLPKRVPELLSGQHVREHELRLPSRPGQARQLQVLHHGHAVRQYGQQRAYCFVPRLRRIELDALPRPGAVQVARAHLHAGRDQRRRRELQVCVGRVPQRHDGELHGPHGHHPTLAGTSCTSCRPARERTRSS